MPRRRNRDCLAAADADDRRLFRLLGGLGLCGGSGGLGSGGQGDGALVAFVGGAKL